MKTQNINKLQSLLESNCQDFIELRALAHASRAGELQDVIFLTEDFMETENQINALNIVKEIYKAKRAQIKKSKVFQAELNSANQLTQDFYSMLTVEQQKKAQRIYNETQDLTYALEEVED